MASDKELGLDRPITRRQFCQGSAVALGASLLPWAQVPAFEGSPELSAAYYPPGLSGLRGDHVGSFETAHALGRRGVRWEQGTDTGEGIYDLVVVGAGISGLSAAWFWRKAHPNARILLLDNHDDFGGHATRNEFTLGPDAAGDVEDVDARLPKFRGVRLGQADVVRAPHLSPLAG